jgi:uncharacterized membrane protein (DUF4010 family)
MPNWKTTVFSLIGGIATALADYAGPNNWQGYVAAAAIAAVGIVAKDFDTHSTSAQVNAADITAKH